MKVKSSMLTQMSGSIAGVTAGHNRGGLYLRARSVPTNPNTARQSLIRSVFSALSQRWASTLTDSQRAGWADYAQNTPLTDALGDPLVLSGQQMYLRANTGRAQIDQTTAGFTSPETYGIEDDAPATPGQANAITGNSVFGLNASTFEATFNTEVAGADGIAVLQVGPVVSTGVSYFKGPYQLAAWTDFSGNDTTVVFSIDITDSEVWLAGYQPSVGQRLPIRLRTIYVADDNSGKVGPVLERFAILANTTP